MLMVNQRPFMRGKIKDGTLKLLDTPVLETGVEMAKKEEHEQEEIAPEEEFSFDEEIDLEEDSEVEESEHAEEEEEAEHAEERTASGCKLCKNIAGYPANDNSHRSRTGYSCRSKNYWNCSRARCSNSILHPKAGSTWSLTARR